jgi:hypothetical protein
MLTVHILADDNGWLAPKWQERGRQQECGENSGDGASHIHPHSLS